MRAFVVFLSLIPALVFGQNQPEPAPNSLASMLQAIPPRELGPTSMGGRITDIAVCEKEKRIFYVASASGGLFKTENGGISFRAVWDKGSTVSLGSVAIAHNNPDIVYIGTGEGNVRNSVSWGDGVYKSTDGGGTWTHLGLKDSKHISQVLVDPRNPDVAFAAAMGPIWGEGGERGVYRTQDGGKTWTRTLFVDDKTGIADLIINPKNPNELIAAAWQARRWAWNFQSGGPGSGVYRSTDNGKTWRKVTKGLPYGVLGRVGLTYFHKDPRIVLATVEKPPFDAFEVDGVGQEVSGGVFKSTDGGESWKRISIINPRPFYFSSPVIDPIDSNRMYLLGVDVLVSDDGGKTFRGTGIDIHSDFHAWWIDPADSNHIILGNDGGLAQSRDKAKTWEFVNNLSLGQFYAVHYDYQKPYFVYGGLQDNGTWAGPTQTNRGGVGFWDFFTFVGGDGFHAQVDPEEWWIVYAESQGGALQRANIRTGESRSIVPRPGTGEARYRFNWSSPILISSHNNKTVYFGGNKLFKSIDRGDTWQVISPDLTTNDPKKMRAGEGSVTPESTGAENHCTIITIGESPLRSNVLWVGTDDGLVQVTEDGGKTWNDVTRNIPDLPANTWCSRVTPSRYVAGRCYATFDGHRNNDYNPYVYMTGDYGKTWTKLNNGLRVNDCAYVIREGTRNPDFLMLGTEMSLYFSLDRGQTWTRYTTGTWPTVAVHDIQIHPRDLDAIIATHGRALWILPVGAFESLTREALADEVTLCKPQPVYLIGRSSQGIFNGDREWRSRNTQPGTTIFFYLANAPKEDPEVRVTTAGGQTVMLENVRTRKAGLNSVRWAPGGGFRSAQMAPGEYRVVLKVDGKEYVSSVTVEDATDRVQGPK